MKCSTINLFKLFALFILSTVIGSCFANGSKPISQLVKSESKDLVPQFKQSLLRWMEIKKQESKLKDSDAIESGFVDCTLCKAAVDSVQLFTRLRADNAVVYIIKNACTYLHLETVDVCNGIVSSFRDEFLLIAKNVDLSAGQLCTISLGNPCNEDIDSRLNWTLPLPPKPAKQEERKYPLKTKENRQTFKFLQISDTHVDLHYAEDTNAACNEPLCCRAKSNYLYSRSLDADLRRKAKLFNVKLSPVDELYAGKWGSYGNCDIPMQTFSQALKQIADKHSNEIDYVIWTGDVPPHDVWRQSKDIQLEMIKKAGEQFTKYLNDTIIYPALGNHEGFPVNSFPPKDILKSHPEINMDWLYRPLKDLWSKWLPESTIGTIKRGAYYSVKAKNNLRIISLNTNYCNDQNWWLLINGTDPENELTWLIDQLHQAEKANEKVHIIGHVPPGKNDCLQIWSENYYRIISRFSNIIKGQFYGHTHSDEFEMFFDHDQLNLAKSTSELTELSPVSVAFLAPSLTTFVGANPGYRIYEVDSSTFEIVNYHNYYLDLLAQNKRSKEDPNHAAVFEYCYNPIDNYQMKDLSAASWLELTNRMYNNLDLLNDFIYLSKSNSSSAAMVENLCGDEICRKKTICNILQGRSHDKNVCDLVIKRFKTKKN